LFIQLAHLWKIRNSSLLPIYWIRGTLNIKDARGN
jgi:hypothetical protein